MSRAAPWLAALAGLALTLAAFWPGYLSWDSAYQWWQARHADYDPIHPPLMAMLWRALARPEAGPGGMLALQAGLVWASLAALAAALPLRAGARAAVVLGLGLMPATLGLLPQLWKDLWFAAAMLLAVAASLRELAAPGWRWRGAALAALALACAFRVNALPAALPLLAWLAWRSLPPGRGRGLRVAGLSVALAVAVAAVASLPSRLPSVRPVGDAWSVVALWDLAAVSLAEGELLFPPEVTEPGLRLEQLRPEFRDYSIGALLIDAPLKHSFTTRYTPAQRAALLRAWLALPIEHPGPYWRHRGRLAWLLLGFDAGHLPDHQVFQPIITPYGDNPPVAPPSGRLHDGLRAAVDAFVDTPVLAAWPYLLLTLLALAVAWRRGLAGPANALAAAVLASGLAYVLPLPLVSGSAEFRYLHWLLLASLVGTGLLALAGRGSLGLEHRQQR